MTLAASRTAALLAVAVRRDGRGPPVRLRVGGMTPDDGCVHGPSYSCFHLSFGKLGRHG